VREWLGHIGVRTLYIEPGSPWGNGNNQSVNGKLRYELLNGEIFYDFREAKVVIERWRREYNTVRPNSALNYRPPAPEAIQPRLIAGVIPWISSSEREVESTRTLTQKVAQVLEAGQFFAIDIR
jgi:hypothetical protein